MRLAGDTAFSLVCRRDRQHRTAQPSDWRTRKYHAGASQHTTVADGLFAPYGVALTDDAAYVTTCAVCVGGGEVIKIPLD
jgi:hypothetical protein